jgi:hypothetical protein
MPIFFKKLKKRKQGKRAMTTKTSELESKTKEDKE